MHINGLNALLYLLIADVNLYIDGEKRPKTFKKFLERAIMLDFFIDLISESQALHVHSKALY